MKSMENAGNTILLINDEPALCRSLALLLRQAGYKVTTAENEEEALEYLIEGEYDLVCLDMKWDQGSSLDYRSLQGICQQCPQTPILFLSDSPQEDAILEEIEGLRFESLMKPLDPPQFLASVNALMTA
jgi:DNA-binding response OmpR family regulator